MRDFTIFNSAGDRPRNTSYEIRPFVTNAVRVDAHTRGLRRYVIAADLPYESSRSAPDDCYQLLRAPRG